MAQCVFCGGEAAFGKTVKFDDFSFRACAGCYDIYSQSSRCLIMRAVKKAGIYKYMGDVSSWLERDEEERAQERKEKAAKLKEDIERCGGTAGNAESAPNAAVPCSRLILWICCTIQAASF